MSKIKVNSLEGVGASTPAISIDNSSGTCTANITNNLSNRNLIINGAMQVSQRGTSFSPTSNEYTVDRFEQAVGSSFNMDTTHTHSTDSPAGFKNSLKVSPDSTQTPTGSHNAVIAQNIEGQNLVSIGYGTSECKQITLSFYAKSSSQNNGQTYTVQISKRISGAQKYVTKTFNISSSWQRFTMTFPSDTVSATETNNTIGMNIFWHLASGPDDIVAESPNAWVSQNGFRAATGQSNFMDNTSNEFYLTGVQLEVGSVATDFEHRSFHDDLYRCYRYFQRYATGDAKPIANGFYYNSGQIKLTCNLFTTMRTTPTLSHLTGTDYYIIYRDNGSDSFNSFLLEPASDANRCGIYAYQNISGTSGQTGIVRCNGAAPSGGQIDFSAEL